MIRVLVLAAAGAGVGLAAGYTIGALWVWRTWMRY